MSYPTYLFHRFEYLFHNCNQQNTSNEYVSPPLVPASRVLSSQTQMRSATFLLRTHPTSLRPVGFSSKPKKQSYHRKKKKVRFNLQPEYIFYTEHNDE